MPTLPPPAAPAPDAEAVAPRPQADRCLNCGADRLGAYCHACGQHHLDDRLTVRVVWREFAGRFLKLERGLLGTTRAALLDPGGLARRYVSGERRRFVNPVSFLLLGSAVAVLLLPLYGSAERMASDPMMAAQADSTRMMASMRAGVELAGGDYESLTEAERAELAALSATMQSEYIPTYIATLQQLYSVFSIAHALALAGAYKLFFAGRDRTYTFAETVVVGCYAAGIYVALAAVIASALAPFAPLLVGTAVSVVLIVAVAALAAWGFYGRTAGNASLGALSGLVALVVYLVVVFVVAIPVVIVKLI